MSLQGPGQLRLAALLVTGPVASFAEPALLAACLGRHSIFLGPPTLPDFHCVLHFTLTASYIVLVVFVFRDIDSVRHAWLLGFSLKSEWMLL